MLEAHGLQKSFGALRVVKDVSVRVEAGECLGIMGPNGAGKSTFFDLLTGTTRADAGTVKVNGKDITGMSVAARAQAGLARAFQVPRPFATLTVKQSVILAQHATLGLSGSEAEASADALLDEVGLTDRADVLGEDLRLLDRKRLELAKALACRPQVILLDEISGGLSSNEVTDMVSLLKGLKQKGFAILWVEHIAHALKEVSDRIMMLHMGEKLIEDTPDIVTGSEQVKSLYLGSVG